MNSSCPYENPVQYSDGGGEGRKFEGSSFSVMLKRTSDLAIDAWTTDPRGGGVAAHSTRDAVPRPRVTPEDREGETRAEA